MSEVDGPSPLNGLQRVARFRVPVGFAVAAAAFWLATPNWRSIGWGVMIAAVGETLRVWAAGHIRKGQEVTASGPYRLTRHPLYLGSLVIGVGFAVAAANIGVAGLVGGYLLVMLWVAIAVEEASLRQSFGPQYDRYSAGALRSSARRFSLSLAIRNGEHRTLLGFVAALGVLALKVWFSGASGA